jgi:hypothetical protein
MKEKDLIELGFELNNIPMEESIYDFDYYYYTKNFGDKDYPFCLISNSSDNVENNEWYVKIFDFDGIKFTNRFQLEKFIEVLNYNTIK